MSAEEKEPYFDGPLVTTPSGQGMFYPGGNQPPQFVPNVGMQQQAPPVQAPAFYNPGEFAVGGANANHWNPPMQPQLPQQQYNANGALLSDNAPVQGAQAYFGGLEPPNPNSSSSSHHTTPEHNPHQPQQKITDGSFYNPTAYEPQMYNPNSSSLFTPAVSTQVQDENSASGDFSNPDQQKVQMLAPQSGGASGQQGFIPSAAPSMLTPSMDANNPGYMNSHVPLQQPPFFVPNPPDLMQSAEPQQLHMNTEEFKSNSAVGNAPLDLHNGSLPSGLQSNDRSYMNMGYNHNYAGIDHRPGHNVNAYVAAELQVEEPVMVPASSGQDYDILHSQGTWKDHNVHGQEQVHAMPEEDPAASGGFANQENQVEDVVVPQIVAVESGQDQAHEQDIDAMENEQVGNVQGPPPEEDADVEPVAEDGINESQDVQGNDPDLTQNEAGASILNSVENLKLDEASGGPPPQTTLSLDYKGGFEKKETEPPVNDAASHNEEQSISIDHTDNVLTDHKQSTPNPSSVAEDGYAVDGAVSLGISPSSESPIPADGLHHRQPVIEGVHGGGSHQFASPNSAFESRIRSQSTGSNNSTNSSQKSVPLLPNRVNQNRQFVLGAAGAADNVSSIKPDTVPTSSPFSTNTMHSSHATNQAPSAPPEAPVQPARATIPDIVCPLPSNSNDENLRTGATMVPYTSSQSLHSQVYQTLAAYPPEPIVPAQTSVPDLSDRPQPDLVQAPLEGANEQLKTSNTVANPTNNLKTNDLPPQNDMPVTSSAPLEPPSVSSDPYLSRNLHNSNVDIPSLNLESTDQSPQDSGFPISSGSTRADEFNPPRSAEERSRLEARQQEDSRQGLGDSADRDSRYSERNPGRRDLWGSRYDDDRRRYDDDRRRYEDDRRRYEDDRRYEEDLRRYEEDHRRHEDDLRRYEDDYRRRGSRDDERYRGRYEDGYRDERLNDSRSRGEHPSRPSSRQSGYSHDDYHHQSRYYDDRYARGYRDSHYRGDRYYGDRYLGYERHYDYRRDDRYYDYLRYSDRLYDYYHSHVQYDPAYYGDYHYSHQRQPEEEDNRSVMSERSTREREAPTELEWRTRHYEYYDPRYGSVYDQSYDHEVGAEPTLSTSHDGWSSLPAGPVRQSPAKFPTGHCVVRFGPGGQLLKVDPNRPRDNQPTTVEIHSIEILLQNTAEAEDLRSYPGPLSKEDTHKNDVLQFTIAKNVDSLKSVDLMDRQSTALIWEFLTLLVRQNGSVLGTDIAELLTKDHSGDFTLLQSPNEVSLQRNSLRGSSATPRSVDDEMLANVDQSEIKSVVSNVSGDVSSAVEKNCFRFRDLLLHGRKKDALEWAMKSGLWGHALLLASRTDSRTHAQVMLRFANSLPINDPLQTVYQLMSGMQPAAATCVSEEGWGDWRPHLAMILSNPTLSPSLDMKAVLTMGDTLARRGLLHAAHFCYLMSSTPLGYYGKSSCKMVLLGGNHMLRFNEFASLDSIRRTEIYEYAISLSKQKKVSSASMSIPTFQLYKFVYACKLAEYGLIAQAFHYCERVARAICEYPTRYIPTLVNQVVNLSDQLRHHDPQVRAGVTKAESLDWLEDLRDINRQILVGSIVPQCNFPPSLATASNSPSAISTSPSAGDEIRVPSPATTDFEDSPKPDYVNTQAPSNQYNQYVSQGYPGDYGTSQAPVNTVPTMTPNTEQPAAISYSQEPPSIPTYNPNTFASYQQPQTNYLNPSAMPHDSQAHPTNTFNQLADQANPLQAGYPPAPSGQYETQTSYGFQPNSEQRDQVNDYYDNFGDMRTAQPPMSNRTRTTSQSSQRSRASTIKGYDMTTPSSMVNHRETGHRSRKPSERSEGRRSRKTSENQDVQKPKPEDDKAGMKKSKSWLPSWFWPPKKPNQVHLPDDNDKEIVWDNEKNRWVNKNGPEEESAPPPPPPTDLSLGMPTPVAQTTPRSDISVPSAPENPPGSQSQTSMPSAGPPQMTRNKFSLKNLNSRSMYKNAFSSSSKPVSAPVLMDLAGMPKPNLAPPSGIMIPHAVPTSQPMEPQNSGPVSHSTPMHRPEESQSIEPRNVPVMEPPSMAHIGQDKGAPPAGPTMFFNPSQFSSHPDILSQPNVPTGNTDGSGPTSRRGRSRYPG